MFVVFECDDGGSGLVVYVYGRLVGVIFLWRVFIVGFGILLWFFLTLPYHNASGALVLDLCIGCFFLNSCGGVLLF